MPPQVRHDVIAALDYCRAKQTSKAAEMEERLAACLATDASVCVCYTAAIQKHPRDRA